MKQVTTFLVDDLENDGTRAAETVRFALDGLHYEIDLSAANAASLRAELHDYIAVARRDTAAKNGRHPVKVTSAGRPKADREQDRAVRAWYAASYPELSQDEPGLPAPAGRGRIPARVHELYRQHGGVQVQPAPAVKSPPAKSAVPKPRKRAAKATKKPAQRPAAKAAPAAEAPDLSRYSPSERRELNEQVRAYARLHGGKVADKGRIPPAAYAAYDAQDPDLLPRG